jgi:hypothetical protein
MNDQPADQPSVIAWYQSPLFVKLLVSLVMQIIALTPLAQVVTSADIAGIVDLVLQIAALALGSYALYDRQKSTVQPLTLTKAGAELASAEASLPTIPTTELQK